MFFLENIFRNFRRVDNQSFILKFLAKSMTYRQIFLAFIPLTEKNLEDDTKIAEKVPSSRKFSVISSFSSRLNFLNLFFGIISYLYGIPFSMGD